MHPVARLIETSAPRAVHKSSRHFLALSRREVQILRLVTRGVGNREVADFLHLSESTVKRHLSNVCDNLAVTTRGEAISRVVSLSFISSWDIAKDE